MVVVGVAGDKFNIIMAEMINPKIKADLYLDRGENESELKQVRTNVIRPNVPWHKFVFHLLLMEGSVGRCWEIHIRPTIYLMMTF